MSDVLAAVRTALCVVPPSALVTVEGDEHQAVVVVGDDTWASECVRLLVPTGFKVEYASRRGDRITVDDDVDWYPRTRRDATALDPDVLTLAACFKHWVGSSSVLSSMYPDLWRHIIECDSVEGEARFGTGSSGACDTCYLEYPAVLWWVSCSCGLLHLGSASSPLERTDMDGLSLGALLSEVEALRDEYLARDARHAPWMPSVSVRR